MELIEIKPIADIKLIIETLTRIGIGNKKEGILYPSCYLYEKNNKYYIVHFKELFKITRKNSYLNISKTDIDRKLSIIKRLCIWNLIEIVDKDNLKLNSDEFIFILTFKEKIENNWKIVHKFNINNLTQDK